jgi:hypothetical protein
MKQNVRLWLFVLLGVALWKLGVWIWTSRL